MKKVVSFIRINVNNEEYTQSQARGIAKYIKDNNYNLEKNIEVEVNIPDEEENIFKLLYLISKVDGTVDDKELYDLKESVYSVSQSLGINSYVNDDQLNNLSKKLNSIESLDDIRNEFEKTLKVLTENKYHEKGCTRN